MEEELYLYASAKINICMAAYEFLIRQKDLVEMIDNSSRKFIGDINEVGLNQGLPDPIFVMYKLYVVHTYSLQKSKER